MRPGSPFSSPNPHKLYRNSGNGRVFGVCAGIADYFGTDPFIVRAGAVLGLFLLSMPTLIGYALLALILPTKPAGLYRSPADEEFWRAVTTKPDVTFAAVRHKFRDLEKRLRSLESHVSTREFEISQAIRDLDRNR
ncbi:MAG: PspC domain-containing protein [Rhodospirillaceae bacterium]